MDVASQEAEGGIRRVTASHDGFQRLAGGGPHKRTWELSGRDSLRIVDELGGRGVHAVTTAFHLHPSVVGVKVSENEVALRSQGNGPLATVSLDRKLEAGIRRSSFSPEFGKTLDSSVVQGRYRGALPTRFECKIRFP